MTSSTNTTDLKNALTNADLLHGGEENLDFKIGKILSEMRADGNHIEFFDSDVDGEELESDGDDTDSEIIIEWGEPHDYDLITWCIPADELNDALAQLPRETSKLFISSKKPYKMSSELSSFSRFETISMLSIENISGFKQLHGLSNTISSIDLKGTGIETLANIPETLEYIKLVNNSNLRITTFPEGIIVIDLAHQHLDHIICPPQLNSLILYRCSFNRLQVSDVFNTNHIYNLQYIKLDMVECDCPYQDKIYEIYNNTELCLYYAVTYPGRYNAQTHLSSTVNGCVSAIKQINIDLDTECVNTMATMQRQFRTLYNINNIVDPIRVMGLHSNIPRRVMEFIVNPEFW